MRYSTTGYFAGKKSEMRFYFIFFVSFDGFLTQSIWKVKNNLHEHEKTTPIESSGDSSYIPAIASTRIDSTQPCTQSCEKFKSTIENMIENYKFSLYNPLLATVRNMGILGADIL